VYQALGFLESIEREPLVAIVHMYCDESGKKSDHPVVTFSGVCLPQAKLGDFDIAWNQLLRHYEIRSLHMARASRLSEKHGPKMPRGQTAEQRMDALMPFADCINEHFELGLLEAFDIKGFNALSAAAKKGLGSPDDPYYIAFSRGILEAVDYIHEDDRLSVVCDDDAETAFNCYQHYRGVRNVYPQVKKKTIALSFADDDYFPALQAADMVAFLSRLEAKNQFYRDFYSFRRLFRYLTKERSVKHAKWAKMFADEAAMKKLGESLERINK
jgi:hypothetical protein